MTRRAARHFLAMLACLLFGCVQAQDVAMRGNANLVQINYVGDVADTLPLARQHCAQYERIPVLHETKPDYVIYFCVKPGAAPGIPS
jgi:hypothetical protein